MQHETNGGAIKAESTVEQTAKVPRKQQGFTLLELVIVLSIIAIFIAILYAGLSQSKEDSKVQAVKTVVLKDFPTSITQLVTMANKCNNTTVTYDKMVARGAPAETVFGQAWTVTTTGGNTVTVTYPLDLQDTDLATDLVDALSDSPNIKSVTGTSAQIVVAYRCN
jgi:prepilin-type N-terminal cleavage/methylation domain-containing protein